MKVHLMLTWLSFIVHDRVGVTVILKSVDTSFLGGEVEIDVVFCPEAAISFFR